jgi:hypothetical protein
LGLPQSHYAVLLVSGYNYILEEFNMVEAVTGDFIAVVRSVSRSLVKGRGI